MPDHVLQAASANDEARVTAVQQLFPIDLERFVEVEEDDIAARRHDAGDQLVVQTEDARNDCLLVLLEHAGFRPLLHEDVDLFLGDWRVHRGAHSQQFEDELGGKAHQPYQGEHRLRQDFHGARNRACDALGIDQCESLRHKLAEDQRANGNPDYDDPECETACVRLQSLHPRKGIRKPLGQGGLA